jgi:hypothetical protein
MEDEEEDIPPTPPLRPKAEAVLKVRGDWLLEKSTGSVCSLVVVGAVDVEDVGRLDEVAVVDTDDCCC